MAEGIASKNLKNYLITSAGTLPQPVNPNAINSMKEVGIDISKNQSKKIDMDKLETFDLIITLCGDAKDNCLNLSQYKDKHIHWDIEDPAKFDDLSKEEISLKYSEVRDSIYNQILSLKKISE